MKIVDEFTGRILEGRRWSEGLHQAVEAKEGVKIKEENQTLATITLQNYFRMYDKLAGMTGTAVTEAAEFASTYDLQVVPIPTNRPTGPQRPGRPHLQDRGRQVRRRRRRHRRALRDRASRCSSAPSRWRSPRSSSRMLEKRGIPHEVLNAKQHTREAEIVAQAGRLARRHRGHQHGRPRRRHPPRRQPRGPGRARRARPRASTSRPTRARPATTSCSTKYKAECKAEGDKVRELGGLYVLGTERHESRRIDNQLRGRSGRQGDPGESRFYLSLEDELMRLFATGAMNWVMGKALPDDVPIEAKMVTKAIERAQNTVEQRNAEIRKNVLKYDEVMNEQRKVIYKRRDQILDDADLRERGARVPRRGRRRARSRTYCVADFAEEWDLEGLHAEIATLLADRAHRRASSTSAARHRRALRAAAWPRPPRYYEQREEELGAETMREIERQVMLQIIDQQLARAPLRDGLPAGGHQPAGHGPEGPARRVAARGLRDVRRR